MCVAAPPAPICVSADEGLGDSTCALAIAPGSEPPLDVPEVGTGRVRGKEGVASSGGRSGPISKGTASAAHSDAECIDHTTPVKKGKRDP